MSDAPASTPAPTGASAPASSNSTKAAPARQANGTFAPGTQAQADAPAPAEGEESAAPEPYRFRKKIKVYGQEEDVDLSEDDLLVQVQKARAYEKKQADFNRRMKELEARESRFKVAPADVLREYGVDLDGLAEQHLAERLQREMMSPEERGRAQLEAERQAFESERKKWQTEREAETARAMDEQVWQREEPLILGALEKVGLPRAPEALKAYAQVGRELLQEGIQATHEQIAREAAKRLERSAQHHLRSLTPEQLVGLLGVERVKALAQHQIAKVKGQAFAKPAQATPQSKAEPATAMTVAEYRKLNGM